jgi:hypothetical protein
MPDVRAIHKPLVHNNLAVANQNCSAFHQSGETADWRFRHPLTPVERASGPGGFVPLQLKRLLIAGDYVEVEELR